MKNLFITLIVLVLLLLPGAAVAHSAGSGQAQQPIECEQSYTVQAGDWLSKLADKYYGDVLAYPAIMIATNDQTDELYATIENPDLIEPGWTLCIPSAEDAQAIMESILQPTQNLEIGCGPLPLTALTLDQEYILEPNEFFLPNQVIVTGRTADIRAVVAGVETQLGLQLISIYELNFEEKRGSFLAETRAALEEENPTPFPVDNNFNELSIILYHVPGGEVPVSDLIAVFNQVAGELALEVFAEPNFAIGAPPLQVSGAQDSVEGGPASVKGGIFDGSVISATIAFDDQWAFANIGLHDVPASVHSAGDPDRPTLVGIFDTSPFVDEGGWSVHWAEPTLDLCVYHPSSVMRLDHNPNLTGADVRDHGLFVAGLAHRVSGQSQIHLIRVLNRQNQGDLGTLINTLEGFAQLVMVNQGRSNLEDTVFNMSLGVHVPSSPNAQIMSLDTILFRHRLLGAVIVASAGNDSADQPQVQDPRSPASSSYVIGVAGTNEVRGRACFSNRGYASRRDVAAPSGDDGPTSTSSCGSKVAECMNNPNYCMISLSMITAPQTGYSFWAGTSFAAPLVSGQAALLLSQPGIDSIKAIDRITSSAHDVGDPNLGWGEIDLPVSLSGLLP